ncbi:MAG: hypothetical protein U0575_07505 [Phycisphaerales bacterium]
MGAVIFALLVTTVVAIVTWSWLAQRAANRMSVLPTPPAPPSVEAVVRVFGADGAPLISDSIVKPGTVLTIDGTVIGEPDEPPILMIMADSANWDRSSEHVFDVVEPAPIMEYHTEVSSIMRGPASGVKIRLNRPATAQVRVFVGHRSPDFVTPFTVRVGAAETNGSNPR